jgi:hypothetical protein
MPDEDVSKLVSWGQALVQAASGAGFPMQAIPDSSDLNGFVAWARGVTSAAAGMMSLPSLSQGADFAEALAWAKALDGQARGMLAGLPDLP